MDSENFNGNQRENLKQWMRRYRDLQADTNRLWDRADDLRGRIEAARTSHLDGMPHTHGGDADRIGGIVSELEEIKTEARKGLEEATAARREISAAIRQICGPRWADRREILRLRYIDGLMWEDVAEKMFGDDPKYWDKAEAFLRRAFKLHTQALAELSEIVPLPEGQENSI